MVHFYNVDPERLLELPPWLVWMMAYHLEPLRARELYGLAAVLMAVIPAGGKPEQRNRQRAMADLRRAAQMPEPEKPKPVEPSEVDPEKAREYFLRMGVQVVKAG